MSTTSTVGPDGQRAPSVPTPGLPDQIGMVLLVVNGRRGVHEPVGQLVVCQTAGSCGCLWRLSEEDVSIWRVQFGHTLVALLSRDKRHSLFSRGDHLCAGDTRRRHSVASALPIAQEGERPRQVACAPNSRHARTGGHSPAKIDSLPSRLAARRYVNSTRNSLLAGWPAVVRRFGDGAQKMFEYDWPIPNTCPGRAPSSRQDTVSSSASCNAAAAP